MALGVPTQQANHFFLCNAKRDNTSNRPTLPWGPGRRGLGGAKSPQRPIWLSHQVSRATANL